MVPVCTWYSRELLSIRTGILSLSSRENCSLKRPDLLVIQRGIAKECS